MVGINAKTVFTFFVLTLFDIETSLSMVVKRQTPVAENDECRMGPRHEVVTGECCTVIPLSQVHDDTMDKCYKELSEDQRFTMADRPPLGGPGGPPAGDHPSPPPEFKPGNHGAPFHFPCMDECLFNKTGRIGSDGKLDKNGLKTSILQKFADEGLETIAQEALEKCLQEVSTMDFSTRVCTSGAFEFNNCFKDEIFLNCPESKWTNTEECKGRKEHILKCPRRGPPPA